MTNVYEMRLKGIIEARERSDALAAIADIHVPHYEGPRNAAEPHTADVVELGQRERVALRKDPADVDERSELYVDVGRTGIEGQHLVPHLQAAGKRVAIVKT